MSIEKQIAKQLKEGKSVSIPGFGSFLVFDSSASFKPGMKDFEPPRSEIKFQTVELHDGNSIMKFLENSISSPQEKIKEFASDKKQKLESQNHVDITGVGTITKHGDEYIFEKDPSLDIKDDTFGLPLLNFDFQPKGKSNLNQTNTTDTSLTTKEKKPQKEISKKQEKQKLEIEPSKKVSLLGLITTFLLTILAITFGILLVISMFGNQNQKNWLESNITNKLPWVHKNKKILHLEKPEITQEHKEELYDSLFVDNTNENPFDEDDSQDSLSVNNEVDANQNPFGSTSTDQTQDENSSKEMENSEEEKTTPKTVDTKKEVASTETKTEPKSQMNSSQQQKTSSSTNTTTNEEEAAESIKPSDDIYIVVGLYNEKDNAEQKLVKAQEAGYSNVQIIKGKKYYRVVIPFSPKDYSPNQAWKEVRERFQPDAWIWN